MDIKQAEKSQKGVLSFVPEDSTITLLDGPMMGTGRVRYDEGSVYEGPLYFDGHHFNKIGQGQQNFMESTLSSDDVGGPLGSLLYLYQGEFDYRKTDWIYGNGVFYFLDSQKNPLAFAKGFFAGLRKIKNYDGYFDPKTLLAGFTPEMEINDLIPHRKLVASLQEKYAMISSTNLLFCGDSWIEFWNYQKEPGIPNLFEHDMQGRKAINVGVGGSTFQDWIPLIPLLITPYHPKKIIVNLGFNDIHYDSSPSKTLGTMDTFISRIRKDLPNVRIYLLNVCHLNGPKAYFNDEISYNQLLHNYLSTRKEITEIPIDKVFMTKGMIRKDMDAFCAADLYHLNREGYRLWVSFLEKYLDD